MGKIRVIGIAIITDPGEVSAHSPVVRTLNLGLLTLAHYFVLNWRYALGWARGLCFRLGG